jgi:heptosyltransferase-2
MVKGVNWIGDTVMTLPALHALRETFPNAFISVFAKSPLDRLLSNDPSFDEVVGYRERKGFLGLIDRCALASKIRKDRYDLALILPNSFSAALIPFLARIPLRTGYGRDGRSPLLTHPIPCTQDLRLRHQSLYYLHLIEQLGYKSTAHLPVIYVDENDKKWAAESLNRDRDKGRTKLIGLCPGATYGPAKQWFPERFVDLARRLTDRLQARTILFGGREEALQIQKISQAIGGDVLDMAGRTDLIQMASLMAECDLVISNDSGPMHIAGAMGTPVLALFGSTDPHATSPLGKVRIIKKELSELSCSPCLKRHCPLGTYECMERISVEEVYEAAHQFLEGKQ